MTVDNSRHPSGETALTLFRSSLVALPSYDVGILNLTFLRSSS